jgi:hypothetical protein
MSSSERLQLEQLIKSWAQDHTNSYIIADPKESDQGIINTGSFLTWLVQEKKANLDLLALVDRLELLLINKRQRKDKDVGGCFCKKCKDFFEYAEPNQEDCSLICYACRHKPYE